MDSGQMDAQFNRAVEIVQGLPKTGPIQTGYEEKLAMYSLFKQATAGDVTGPRPGMFDMLGRAKWDAWEKQRGLDSQQAKYLYVETLQKVLRKYSDRTVAKDLVQELDSYVIDAGMIMSGSLAQSDDSSSSRSASPVGLANVNRRSQQFIQANQLQQLQQQLAANQEEEEEDEEQIPEEGNDLVPPTTSIPPLLARPHSAVSSHMRYRTPLATTAAFSPTSAPSILPTPPSHPIQPMPRYATPSAFTQPHHPGPLPPAPSSSASYPTSLSYIPQISSPNIGRQAYHPSTMSYARSSVASESGPGMLRQPLERAVESLQATLAALHERMDALEAYLHTSRTPRSSYPGRGGSPSSSSPFHHCTSLSASLPFDPSQTGAWSIILKPLYQAMLRIEQLAMFLFHPPNPSTATARLIIIRRLLLDSSFAIFVLVVIRTIWRATGIRRKEVFRALLGVWHAMTGTQNRVLVDRGV